jgi:antitoxin (DNA-binding transcriptional repressor) of toxin-antitoxin stability system
VTSRGKEVARLLPPRSRRRAASTEAELIARFRSLPWVRPGSGKKPTLPKPLIRIGKGEKTLAEIVSEQRG